MSRLTSALAIASFALSTTSARADDHNADEPQVAAERGELIVHASEERTKKLKRKTKTALKFVRAQGRYMDHRVITVNIDALQRLDPLPGKPEDKDSPEVVLEFEMSFTPGNGETYLLKNTRNYGSEFFGKSMIMWQGTIENMDGEAVGEYLFSDMDGKYDISSFAFPDSDHGWGIRNIEGEPEMTLVKMSRPKE